MKDTFVEKISKKFADLSRAEEILLQAVAIGSVAECGFNEEGDGIARQTKDYCCVRAALLRWLCTDKEGKNFVDVRGIRIRAAVITGRLDLAFVTVPFPLALTQCVISEGIDITEADVRSLALDGSHCGGIAAAQLLVRGSLYLRDGFSAHGEVRLRGATIKGSLECRGGSFSHPGMEALSADGINIEGSMFMDQGFRAVGNVRLVGANIGKMLVCSGARLLNKGAEA